MQGKKILMVVSAVALVLLLLLYLVPMHRTYSADIVVSADELIINRTICDTANWDKWYSDGEISQPRPVSFRESAVKKDKLFDYNLATGEGYKKEGWINVSRKNRWEIKLTWSEKLIFKNDIVKKFRLLFHPADFSPGFLQNVVRFKNVIEHPDHIFGGLVFERKEVPAGKLVTLSDTVMLSEVKDRISGLHNEILGRLAPEDIKNPGVFMSQYEMLEDSSVVLCVAVNVRDEFPDISEPFELIEMDEHPVIMIQTHRGYTNMDEDIAVMYEWLKRNDKRPATSYWVQHTPSTEIAQASGKTGFTIIQEVYSIK